MRINISERQQFILRVAGIFARNNSILLHRAENDDIWALPGGACEFHEDTESALAREIKEELGATIEAKHLAFAVENFFEWNDRMAHEVGFYHVADEFYETDEFEGVEDKMEGVERHRLFFKWIPIQSLSKYKIKPEFLKSKLESLSQQTLHIINRD